MMTTTTLNSLEKPKRLKTLTRAPKEDRPGSRLTPRDVEILKAVHDFRVLTTHQISALFFTLSLLIEYISSRCRLRLRHLYHEGYLGRLELPTKLSEGRKPLVYFLDELGAEYLSKVEGYPVMWDPPSHHSSHAFLTHLLATNDVRIAMVLSAKKNGLEIPVWLDEKILKHPHTKDTIVLKGERGGREKAAVVPDFYFRLETQQQRFHFFGERDLGTVTVDASGVGQRDWARKIRAYLEYYRSGAYEKRYHTRDMRVLTITTGERRLAHLRAVTEEVGGKSRFWFATFEAIQRADILRSPIWYVATWDGLHALL